MEYVEVSSLIPGILKDFRFSEYPSGERNILNPALHKIGLTMVEGWKDGERDSFGPLSRVSTWKEQKTGKIIHIMYG